MNVKKPLSPIAVVAFPALLAACTVSSSEDREEVSGKVEDLASPSTAIRR